MGPRELVLNPKVSAWRHPDGAVKANRPPPRATTAGAPDCCSSNRSAVSFAGAARGAASRRTVGDSGGRRFSMCRGPRGFDDLSDIVSRAGVDGPEPRRATRRGWQEREPLPPGAAHESMH
jgi:hypothetical protein